MDGNLCVCEHDDRRRESSTVRTAHGTSVDQPCGVGAGCVNPARAWAPAWTRRHPGSRRRISSHIEKDVTRYGVGHSLGSTPEGASRVRSVDIWEVGRRPTEADDACPYRITAVAGMIGVCIGRPGNGAVWVCEGLGEFVWVTRVGGIFVERISIDGVHGVEGTNNSVGHGVRVRRGKTKTN